MKNLKNLGKTLNKEELKTINGGAFCTSAQLALGCVNVISSGKWCLCPF